MQGAENHVSGERGSHSHLGGFQVSYLSHHDHVRILADNGPQSGCKGYPRLRVDLGLANRTAPANTLVDDAVAWARSLAERAPLSVAATKKAMRHAMSGSWADTFDIEAPIQQKLRHSEDCNEGVRAFFEKRKPDFKGK